MTTDHEIDMDRIVSSVNVFPVANSTFILMFLALCVVMTLAGIGLRYWQAHMRDVRYTQSLVGLKRDTTTAD